MEKKDRGFTLIELIITISIFAILLGILIPSLNSVLGFRVQRATDSITAALDRTRVEALSRLVGEMKLEKRSDGYYISYYLDRGKQIPDRVSKKDEAQRIAPARTIISYTTASGEHVMQEGDSLILTYNREDASFRPIQSSVLSQEAIRSLLESGKDIPFEEDGPYCEAITVKGGGRTRVIGLITQTGRYTVTKG